MRKKLALVMTVVALAMIAMGAVSIAADAPAGTPATANDVKHISYYGYALIGCGLAIGLAGLGTGIGMGHGLRGATEGTARNPGVSGKIMTTLIIGIAMIESCVIYALVIVLIILYAKPFGF